MQPKVLTSFIDRSQETWETSEKDFYDFSDILEGLFVGARLFTLAGMEPTTNHPRLHHLALGAQDVGGLAEFYRKVLELQELARHRDPHDGSLRSVWLDLGGGAVLMIEKTCLAARERVEGVDSGIFLLAMTADDEGVERCLRVLEEEGICMEGATEFTRYFRDPEGNRFALSRYPLPGG